MLSVEAEMETELVGPHVPMYARKDMFSDGTVAMGAVRPSIRSDLGNILLLVFLYTLQGIPLGLTASIPLVLQNHHVTYKQQAVFSFAHWPFSLKLLWAPIVDSIFSVRVGRRKSWLVPTQYLIGLFMWILSTKVDSILGSGDDVAPDLVRLTAIFFAFNFLAATQDIVVDGWALTILSSNNVGYASTCNVVGQTAGYFLGNAVFLALESKDFCNNYLRARPLDRGVVTLSEYLHFWAMVFFVTTTLVLILKAEGRQGNAQALKDVGKTYRQLLGIIRLRPVITVGSIYLTAKVAFAAADGITGLKLIELGVPKDHLALLAVPIIPLELLLPVMLAKYTAGPRPLDVYLWAYPYRNLLSLVFAFVVFWTPAWKSESGTFSPAYYGLVLVAFAAQQYTAYCMFVSQMAFHAQISDPVVGGTYMTLLNTLANLGSNWPVTVSLSVVDSVTYKVCNSEQLADCHTLFEGYYVLIFCGVVIGLLWMKIAGSRFRQLQSVQRDQWSAGCF